MSETDRTWGVGELAQTTGLTVRTLHHYDEIGLLKPASVGANGYRYYGREELLRLQRILFHRELGVPLSAIGELLDLEGANQIGVLMQHREKLEAERERYRVLIETIDRTIAGLRGDELMANTDLYKGFSAEKQAGYEAWLIERYGDPMRSALEHSRKSYAKLTAAEQAALGKEFHDVEQALAGQTASKDTIEAAARLAGSGVDYVNSDLHASEEYRRAMIDVFARRALTAALARA